MLVYFSHNITTLKGVYDYLSFSTALKAARELALSVTQHCLQI